MPSSRIKYVNRYTNQHGKEMLYYRPPGQPKTRLRGPVGSPEFWEDYVAASTGGEVNKPTQGRGVGTLAWLIQKYRYTAHWKGLSPRTRYVRDLQFTRFCDLYGGARVKDLKQRHLYAIQDKFSDTPAEIDNIFKALRPAFKFAVKTDLIEYSPFVGLDSLGSRNPEGFRAWTGAEMKKFEAHWPIGTTQRIAYELFRQLGQRLSDVHLLGRQHETEDGWLRFTQFKGRNKKPMNMEIPIPDELRAVLDASPTGDMTYLVSERGRPFATSASLGGFFRRAVRKAGLSGVSAHGLRKSFAAKQAEEESTTKEIMALGGWRTLSMVQKYTESADRKRLNKNVQARRRDTNPEQN
jgi:integrase